LTRDVRRVAKRLERGDRFLRLARDVTDPEPLSTGHPLFALPNVLISPNVSGQMPAMPS
jgi:phosphoglycerate dehydrogenase-like enzyme